MTAKHTVLLTALVLIAFARGTAAGQVTSLSANPLITGSLAFVVNEINNGFVEPATITFALTGAPPHVCSFFPTLQKRTEIVAAHTPPISFQGAAIDMLRGGKIFNAQFAWGAIRASNDPHTVEFYDCAFTNVAFHIANATFGTAYPCVVTGSHLFLHGNVFVPGAQGSAYRLYGSNNTLTNCSGHLLFNGSASHSNLIAQCHFSDLDGLGDFVIQGNANTIRTTIFEHGEYYSTLISGDDNVLQECVAYSNATGFAVTGSRNLLEGCCSYWNNKGVQLNGNSNILRACRIGLDAAGTSVLANAAHGIEVRGVGNLVGGGHADQKNIICGSGMDGIRLEAARGARILKNYIGLAPDGSNGFGNTRWGVSAQGCSNLYIGDYLDGNIIASNRTGGILLDRCTNTVVMDNYIGADRYGLNPVGNHGHGVRVEQSLVTYIVVNTIVDTRPSVWGNGTAIYALSSSNAYMWGNHIGVNALGTNVQPNAGDGIFMSGCQDVLVGGMNYYDRNIIAGNSNGIVIAHTYDAPSLIRVINNFVGVDRHGTNAPGNRGCGIVLDDVQGVRIGGPEGIERNVIAGNREAGIMVLDSDDRSTSNVIQGNYIGTDVTGLQPAGNHDGILLMGPRFTQIGGAQRGDGNLIAANRGHGVAIQKRWWDYPLCSDVRGNLIRDNASNGVNVASGIRNVISSNAIHGSGLMGVNLGMQGRNDGPESDANANRYQRYPFISNVVVAGGTRVRGSFASAASKTYRLEFFASPAVSPAGFAEGQQFLGAIALATGAGGNAAFDTVLPVAAQPGWIVAATATDPDGNTSELCAHTPVNGVAPDFTVNKTLVTVGEAVQFTDLSSGAPVAWYWDFDNNGTIDSTARNPSHTYTTAGDKTVKLTASNMYGAASESKVALVRVAGATRAAGPVDDVQALINTSQPYDTIVLSAGVYRAGSKGPANNVLVVTQPLTLLGLGGTGDVMIDGEGARRCLYVVSGRVANVTCINGIATNPVGTHAASSEGIGAGALLEDGELDRCIIRACRASAGGGIFTRNASWVRSTLIISNDAGMGGGIILGDGSIACNVTIADNTASTTAGGALLLGGQLWNSIVVRNMAPTNENWQRNDGSINFSCAQPHPGGFDSTDADPGLQPDYTIPLSSPAVDHGYTFAWMSSGSDLAGDMRIYGNAPDMGAYEAIPEPAGVLVVLACSLLIRRCCRADA